VPFLLGLTGNIACGKSSVGQLLTQRYGIDYIDADRVVHALYAAETPQTRAIATRFGQALLQPDGTIDRRRLGDIVMSDPGALKELERILDPGVRQTIDARIAGSVARVVVLDAIRLIEGGLYARCDAVWVVVCDPWLQSERLQATRNLSAEQAALRISAQTPVEEKLRHAAVVLTNDTTLAALETQIVDAWARTVQPHLSAD
jgi:dephospho-CoA kinase